MIQIIKGFVFVTDNEYPPAATDGAIFTLMMMTIMIVMRLTSTVMVVLKSA